MHYASDFRLIFEVSPLKIYLLLLLILSSKAFSWVHISQLKPKLPAEKHDSIYFYWDGVAPSILAKEKIFEGSMSLPLIRK